MWFLDKALTFGSFEQNPDFEKSLIYEAPASLLNNESVYCHIFIAQNGFRASQFLDHRDKVLRVSKQLNYYMPRKSHAKTRKLVAAGDDQTTDPGDLTEEDPAEDQIISYWWPNVSYFGFCLYLCVDYHQSCS